MRLVGLNPTVIVVIVSVVGMILYGTIQYIESTTKDKVTIEILEETQERKETIRETIQNNKPVDRGDATDSLQYLQSR